MAGTWPAFWLMGDGYDGSWLEVLNPDGSLASEVQIGSPIVGNYALESIAAAVLGGASLAGGKGSYVGTLLAAFFLALIGNALPLFQQPTEYADMLIGLLILLALVLYQGPELLERLRSSSGGVGRLRTRQGEAPTD